MTVKEYLDNDRFSVARLAETLVYGKNATNSCLADKIIRHTVFDMLTIDSTEKLIFFNRIKILEINEKNEFRFEKKYDIEIIRISDCLDDEILSTEIL